MTYLARRSQDGARDQALLEHLNRTAALAAQFAAAFGAEELAQRAGLLHDIGKYSDMFQRRVCGSDERVDHATAGAITAWAAQDLLSAFCIAGHHGHLPMLGMRGDKASSGSLLGRFKRVPGKEIEDFSAYLNEVEIPDGKPSIWDNANLADQFFFIRMLFSCLVDADRLDAAAFDAESEPRSGMGEPLPMLMAKLERYVAPWLENPNTPLDAKRSTILKTQLESGALARGLFSFTVPTGGGKTVASMAFALRHALAHGLRRVIYVIPYVSILEQTQATFEKIFGKENVVAHYANLIFDDDDDTAPRRLQATENWDAPIVLTTAVQFFESLFAARATPCRKIHNIVGSVVIFDEAQMLPVPYISPCIWSISQLIKHYNCSAVLCTATQPSLDRLLAQHLPDYPRRELCPDRSEMEEVFRRVCFTRLGKQTDEDLAQRLSGHEQVLCVVNNRRQAQSLWGQLPEEGSFHLSTTMTPEHRRRVLETIRARLKTNQTCRVVSTSLIEAGVDVDFPTVYRAMAGLDSLLQAAGRCNREGKRKREDSVVHIFDSEAAVPPSMQQNVAAARRAMEDFEDIATAEAVESYFKTLFYGLKTEAERDKKQILCKINSGAFDYPEVAEKFKLIDVEQFTVYIPQGAGAALVEQWRSDGPDRELMRKLGLYAVGVYPQQCRELLAAGAAKPVAENAAVLIDMSLYSEKTGLAFHPMEGACHII